MEQTVYNWEGKKAGTINVPERLFALPWNADLVHQVVNAARANARANTAYTKDRSAVSGGGKKPWKQKGTGRARHGSIRSPLWRGGGVTHGPTAERNYERKTTKKMRAKALFTVLSQKLRDGELFFVEAGQFTTPKTSEAQKRLAKLASGVGAPTLTHTRGRRALIATAGVSDSVVKSFRNIPTVSVEEVRNLHPKDILTYRYLVIENPAESITLLESRSTTTK